MRVVFAARASRRVVVAGAPVVARRKDGAGDARARGVVTSVHTERDQMSECPGRTCKQSVHSTHMATRARARAAGAAPARTRRGRARRPRFARAASTRAVDVYWDLDNLCPKRATAAVVFERVLAAGAAFGRVNHPVRAYANDQTLARLAEDGEWLEGVVEVTACASSSEAADDALGDALTRAVGGEDAPVFSGKKRLMVDESGVNAEMATERASAIEEATFWADAAREARAALPTGWDVREEQIEAIVRGRDRVVLIVTSDNDFKLAMDYAAAKGVVVVVLGNLVDFSSAQRSRASDPKKYWDALRVECERRPLSRLKLVQSCVVR